MPEDIKNMKKNSEATSAFLDSVTNDAKHIVDVLIEERCPKLCQSGSWPLLRPLLYKILGYTKARQMADEVMKLNGRESFDRLAAQLSVSLSHQGLEGLPKTGRVIIAANHPTGLADGIAVWDLLKQVRDDVVFFANADAIRVNPRFEDVIIPVEWVAEKRSPAKARETLKRAAAAFAEEKCVVIFPSGRLAHKVAGRLEEKDWFSTVVSLARKRNAPIVPINVSAENSWLYYFFCRLNPELRDITLFNELLNKSGSPFDMIIGPLIPHERLDGDASEVAERLRDYVAYGLRDDPAAVF